MACEALSRADERPVEPPGQVASLTPAGAGNCAVVLAWQDPPDTDLDHIEITYKSNYGSSASASATSIAAGMQTPTVAVPANSAGYTFFALAVDKAGNKSGQVSTGNFSFVLPAGFVRENHFTGSPPGTANGHAIYAYNTSGMLASTTEYDNVNAQFSQTTFEYASGSVLRTKTSYFTWESTSGTWVAPGPPDDASVVTTYATSGSMTGTVQKDEYYDNANTLTRYSTYDYDASGNYLGWTDHDSTGNRVTYSLWSYTPTSERWEKHDGPSGALLESAQQDYDSAGRITKVTSYDSSGNMTWQERRTYDSAGNMTQKQYLSGNPLAPYAYEESIYP